MVILIISNVILCTLLGIQNEQCIINLNGSNNKHDVWNNEAIVIRYILFTNAIYIWKKGGRTLFLHFSHLDGPKPEEL